jgi:ParB family transcriptional regulator, chromosome partitioning protein
MEKKALGKGLSALIPEKTEETSDQKISESIRLVPINSIRENSKQPRQRYDEKKIAELQASIKDKGVLQPILVRETADGYEVIAGERRLRAARANNFIEVPVVIKKVTDQEALVLALVENIQREELNPIEEAHAFRRLSDDFGLSQEDVATSVGKDRSTVSNLLRLLKLPQDIQEAVMNDDISMGHARALVSIEDTNHQKHLFKKIIKKGLSVREVESIIRAELEGTSRQKRRRQDTKSHDVVLLEEALQQFLGTKVRIQAQKKRGKIIIEYYSLDDLKRILQIIQNKSAA